MHRKSENNEFDIVLEAEAVLAAYSERCRVYSKKAERRQKGMLRRIACGLFYLCGAAGVVWFIFFML